MALDDELESGIPLGQDQAVESGQIQPPTLPPGIPYNPEGVVSSPYAAPVQAPPRVVIGSGPTPGLLPPSQRPLAGASPAAIAQEQFRESNPNLPIDQAEAAYAAALRFQGQRAYEEDLQRGMPQAQAFAKNAMHMFASPKTTLAQAGAFMKDITPKPVMTPYQEAEIAQRKAEEARRVKEAADKAAKAARELSPVQKAELGADITELRGIQKQIGGTEEHGFGILHPFGGNKSEMEGLRKKASDLRKQIEEKYGGNTSTGNTSSEKITTKDQYDALPSGTVYVGKDGKRYRKP